MRMKWRQGVALTTLMTATVFSALTAGEPAAMMALPAPLVAVEPAIELNESNVRQYVAAAEAIEEVTLRLRVSGVLEKINFIEGAFVKKDDLLFEIEKETYEANYKSAEARLNQITAELTFAEQNYQRQQNLAKEKVIANRELEDAERRYNLAKAQFAEANFNLVVARRDWSYTRIVAPISGRISKVTYTRGNYLTPASEPLANIVQVAPIYVNFAISERDFTSLFGNAAGMQRDAVVRVRAADGSILEEVGKVTLVDNRVDVLTGTIKVWVTFENKNHDLLPGGLVGVIVSKVSDKKVAAVKVTALLTTKNGHAVYVVGENDIAELRPIEIGEIVGEQQTVLKGLQVGEKVVTDGTHKVRPGAPVKY